MSYKELRGICRYTIYKNECLGCNRLEDENFIDLCSCKLVNSQHIEELLAKEQAIYWRNLYREINEEKER